ncbi:MAG: hypothetical protein IH936_03910 [Acidobacteria bacterium]|nr:hypothetical protein [Acidobacteriota bacterium]
MFANGVFATLGAVERSPRWLSLAAIASWVFSFLGSWSIGLATLVVTFIFFALAAGRALGWITRPIHAGIAMIAGVTLWFISVSLVDDYWLFYPWAKILALLGG